MDQVASLSDHVRAVKRVPEHAVGAPRDESSIGRDQSEGTREREEGPRPARETQDLEAEPEAYTQAGWNPVGRSRKPPKDPPYAASQSRGRRLTTEGGRRARNATETQICWAVKTTPIRRWVSR